MRILTLSLLLAACGRGPPPCDEVLRLFHDDVAAEAQVMARAGMLLSNTASRDLYRCLVARIGPADAVLAASGATAQQRAEHAWRLRHEAKQISRALMSDAAARDALYTRDRARYGNPDGPSLHWLYARQEAQGVFGDEAFLNIVASSQRINTQATALAEVGRGWSCTASDAAQLTEAE